MMQKENGVQPEDVVHISTNDITYKKDKVMQSKYRELRQRLKTGPQGQ